MKVIMEKDFDDINTKEGTIVLVDNFRNFGITSDCNFYYLTDYVFLYKGKNIDYIKNSGLVSGKTIDSDIPKKVGDGFYPSGKVLLRFRKNNNNCLEEYIDVVKKYFFEGDINGDVEGVDGKKYCKTNKNGGLWDFSLNQRVFDWDFTKCKKAYFDVETMYPSFPDKVCVISFFDEEEKKFYCFNDSNTKWKNHFEGYEVIYQNWIEINAFLDDKKYDVLFAWNANFDRKELKINFGAREDIYYFDLLHFYKKLVRESRTSYSLNNIGLLELGKGKKVIDKKNMDDEWRNNKNEVIEYNLLDVLLCYEIDKKVELWNFVSYLANYINAFISQTEWGSRIIKHLLIRKNEKYIPDVSVEGEKVKFEGGYCKEPVLGYHENILVWDMSQLYPSIICTFNMGVETFKNEYTEGDSIVPGFSNYFFDNKKNSILKDLCIELMEERQKIRSQLKGFVKTDEKINLYRKQYAIKVIANTIYGTLGHNKFFQFKKEVGESITSVGRENLKNLIRFCEENKLGTVLYTDTDSLMVSCNRDRDDITRLFNKEIERWVLEDCGCKQNFMEIKYEKEYKKFLIVKKKKYAGLLEYKTDEGSLKQKNEIKGFECVRGDHSLFSKKIQKMLLTDILENGKVTIQYPKEDCDILNEKLFDLAIPKKLSKELVEYSTLPIHVRAAKTSKLDLKKGDTVYYLNLRAGRVQAINGMNDLEIEQLRNNIDFNYLWEKTIKKKITQITDLVVKKVSLMDFCG